MDQVAPGVTWVDMRSVVDPPCSPWAGSQEEGGSLVSGAAAPCLCEPRGAEPPSPLPAAVLYFLLQVSFLVDEGVSPVLLQLLSCALWRA